MIIRIMVVILALALAVMPVYAAPNKAGKSAVSSDKSANAGERIIDHTADAIADVLTGEDSAKSKSSGDMPPGLAKKDKTPPGWSKGEKTGWNKEGEKKDSPIQAAVKAVLTPDQDKKK